MGYIGRLLVSLLRGVEFTELPPVKLNLVVEITNLHIYASELWGDIYIGQTNGGLFRKTFYKETDVCLVRDDGSVPYNIRALEGVEDILKDLYETHKEEIIDYSRRRKDRDNREMEQVQRNKELAKRKPLLEAEARREMHKAFWGPLYQTVLDKQADDEQTRINKKRAMEQQRAIALSAEWGPLFREAVYGSSSNGHVNTEIILSLELSEDHKR